MEDFPGTWQMAAPFCMDPHANKHEEAEVAPMFDERGDQGFMNPGSFNGSELFSAEQRILKKNVNLKQKFCHLQCLSLWIQMCQRQLEIPLRDY